MSLPAVSVIIPTYNHRDFILGTLESVFCQSFSDFEVIVVNDGSPDDTHDLLSSLIGCGRIRYFAQANQGQARARNRGVAEARGRYIALLDDDDLWPPDKLEWQTAFLDEHPHAGMVGGTLQLLSGDGAPGRKGNHHATITRETLFNGNPFYSPGQTLIRSDVLRNVGGLDDQIWGADDWDLWFRIARRTEIVMLDRLALHYRIHSGNSSNQSARLLEACCSTIDRHLRDEAPDERARLRAAAHLSIYGRLGSKLVGVAKQQLRTGDVVAALGSLRGLQPLAASLAFTPEVRRAFLADIRWA